MIVMPANHVSKITKELYRKYPSKIALLNSPFSWKTPFDSIPYAIDNGCFKSFNEDRFFKTLQKAKKFHKPLFVVCPDVLGCHDRTLALWYYYYPILEKYTFPIAFVVQNGCTPESIPIAADWLFIGGTDPWKIENIKKFVNIGKPVHVGRVNTINRLTYCEEIGVDSIDGTGWLRSRKKQFHDLMDWFCGEKEQLELF